MARKFSLKDNPIFQRLEVPKPRETRAQPDATGSSAEVDIDEGQKEPRKKSPANFDPQILTHKEKEQETNSSEEATHQRQSDFDPNSQRESPKEGQNSASISPSQYESRSSTPLPRDYSEGQKQTINFRPSNSPPPRSQETEKPSEADVTSVVTASTGDVDQGKVQERKISTEGPEEIDQGSGPRECKGDIEAQILSLKKIPSKRESLSSDHRPNTTSEEFPPGTGRIEDLGLKDHLDKSLFFSFYNEVTDDLLPLLDAAEQVLYSRLFRLSYGFNRNYCAVSQPVLGEKTGLSRNTVRTSLQSLIQKNWIHVVEAGNHISTTYRVFLPREKKEGSEIDPQNQNPRNRPSKYDRQDLSVKFRSSKTDNQEGQKTAVQNLLGKPEELEFTSSKRYLQSPQPYSDPQKMTPLTITNNSFTLSPRELDHQSNYQGSHSSFLSTSAHKLVDQFYALLNQQPSTAKREKSVSECMALLRDGFSVEQVDYAVRWLVAQYPTTGSFSRVAHFIDQALKAKEEEQQEAEIEGRKKAEVEQLQLEEKRLEEEGKRIDEVKASLSAEELDALSQEASQLIEQEHGLVRFGRETLIQLKVRDRIRARYLKPDRS